MPSGWNIRLNSPLKLRCSVQKHLFFRKKKCPRWENSPPSKPASYLVSCQYIIFPLKMILFFDRKVKKTRHQENKKGVMNHINLIISYLVTVVFDLFSIHIWFSPGAFSPSTSWRKICCWARERDWSFHWWISQSGFSSSCYWLYW